jgi:hypothetical protein
MSLVSRIRSFFARARPGPISDWFVVTFDDHGVTVRADPPGREGWSQSFAWDKVIRVCFKAEDLYASDGIYVFTSERPESYAIPTEARGGSELWGEILRRELFDAKLAIEAAGASEGLFCWPLEKPAG